MQVAVLGHLDNPHATVLLMVGAEAAIIRAAIADLRRKLQRNPPRTVETSRSKVHLRVGADDTLEQAVLGTAFLHVDPTVPNVHLRVQDPPTDWADAPGQLNEDGIPFAKSIGLQGSNEGLERLGFLCYPQGFQTTLSFPRAALGGERRFPAFTETPG